MSDEKFSRALAATAGGIMLNQPSKRKATRRPEATRKTLRSPLIQGRMAFVLTDVRYDNHSRKAP